MRVILRVVGVTLDREVAWPEDWPVPRLGDGIELPGDGVPPLTVGAVDWYPEGDPDNEDLEPFVYVAALPAVMNAETEHRLLVAAERIGTGLLRLAAAAETRLDRDAKDREEDRPRDVDGRGLWLRPSQVDSVLPGTAKSSGYTRDVVRIRLRSGRAYLVWRGGRDTETREDLLARVLRALGWQA